MVEIHTHSLNKELISICNEKVDTLLKAMTTKINQKIKALNKELNDHKAHFEGNTLKTSQTFDQYKQLKSYESNLQEFIYTNKRDLTDKYMKIRKDYFILLNLMYDFQTKDAKLFHDTCNLLNDVNNRISIWESDQIEAKESFINKCKDRRIKLLKDRDEIITTLNEFETNKNNLLLQKEGMDESKVLYERVKSCINDDENTQKALHELEDEPAQIDNLKEVAKMVENEYNIWNSYGFLTISREQAEQEVFDTRTKPGFDFIEE